MTRDRAKPTVTYFQRKPMSVGNYSVEFIFNDVRQRLKDQINIRNVYSKYESRGLFKRIYNSVQAFLNQGDVNHITGDINYVGFFLKRRITIHTILDIVNLTRFTGIKYKVFKYFWLTVPVKRSKYITAISEATKQEILKHIKVSPEKIKVIYVAISEKFKRVDKPFNKQQPRILQIGAASNKNIERLIEALEGIPCVLEIIGKQNDDYERLLKQKAVKYEYKWNLSNEQMLERYAAADIIALASTYEGFGMPILEGQSVGRPVITSNILSMPEVAGDAAVLVDPYDVADIRKGILQIIENDSYRESLVQKGFHNVRRFDAQAIAQQYLNLYLEVANN